MDKNKKELEQVQEIESSESEELVFEELASEEADAFVFTART